MSDCEWCGETLVPKKREGRARFAARRFCCKECGASANQAAKAGSRQLSPTTRYRKTSQNGKTMLMHRVVVEAAIGRALERHELVHHINGDRTDNRLTNLEITSAADHAKHHNQKHPPSKACAACGAEFTPHPTKRARAKTCSKECHRVVRVANGRAQRQAGPPPFAKLDEAKVAAIRVRYAAGGVSQRLLGEEYGVHPSVIGLVVNGRTWRAPALEASP